MKTVTLQGTQLIVMVQDQCVFEVGSVAGSPLDLEQQKKAWDQARLALTEEAAVFLGTVDAVGRKVYVVLLEDQYPWRNPPPRIRTPEELKAAHDRKVEADTIALRKNARLDKEKKFEHLPKIFNGADWGREQRVLIRTSKKVLAVCPAYSYVQGRYSLPDAMPALMHVFCIAKADKGVMSSNTFKGMNGQIFWMPREETISRDWAEFQGERFSPKTFLTRLLSIAIALNVPVELLQDHWDAGWRVDRTLVLK